MTETTQFYISDADIQEVPGGALLLAQTVEGQQLSLVLTIPVLQKLAQRLSHQTKHGQSPGSTPHQDNSQD
jgi:hypothetical protein